MAIAWALRDRRVTSVVLGSSRVEQLEQNVAALENAEFSDEELREIDEHAREGGIDLWAGTRGD
jgi:L-glyceraldehyde 3-phosphate reductase